MTEFFREQDSISFPVPSGSLVGTYYVRLEMRTLTGHILRIVSVAPSPKPDRKIPKRNSAEVCATGTPILSPDGTAKPFSEVKFNRCCSESKCPKSPSRSTFRAMQLRFAGVTVYLTVGIGRISQTK
jgi:hypothetical protein